MYDKIKRCKKCGDILDLTSGNYGLVDYLCYACWTKREESKSNMKGE